MKNKQQKMNYYLATKRNIIPCNLLTFKPRHKVPTLCAGDVEQVELVRASADDDKRVGGSERAV